MPSLELPHWPMIAGTALAVAGLIGVLVSRKKPEEVEPPRDEPTDTPRQQMPPLPSLSIPGQGTTPSFGRRTGTAPAQVASLAFTRWRASQRRPRPRHGTDAPRAGNSKAAGILVPQPNR
jgi:hypothetical protein